MAIAFSGRAEQPVDHVNPFIGTVEMGHTFPGACVPYGAVQLSPDTDTIPQNVGGVYNGEAYRYCAGYQYNDPTIVGFSHTHLSGTGHSDLGDILVMPQTGPRQLNPGTAAAPESGYRSVKAAETETASPGYYSVRLADGDILAELTATERTGVHRYTYPEGETQRVIVDLEHGIYNYDGKTLWAGIRVESDTLITGYRVTNGWARENYVYFAAAFSRPIAHYGYEDRQKPLYTGFWRKFDQNENFPEMSGRKVVSWFEFAATAEPLEIRVALSAVDTAGALANLRAETDGKGFDDIRAGARAKWSRELDRFEAEGTDDQLAMFYTSLYHTMINPSVYMDVDGRYRGIDHNIHKAEGFTNYTVFSMWDTYRALHPLFDLVGRRRNADMMRSMLEHRRQSVHGALPVWSHMGNENWCMIGYHSVPALADAIRAGLPVDGAEALDAMKSSANVSYYDGTDEFRTLGYVPAERNGSSASITLEYAYDDWTIYATALAAGDAETAEIYGKRARNWHNVFDPQTGFARPRMADGGWREPFDVLDTHGQGFIEGNSWNYSFYVPHDVNGLMAVMGGDGKFVERLDDLFTMELPDRYFENTEDISRDGIIGNYVHGNEPSHHVAYLYAWTSQPWKTQDRVRRIMNRMYVNSIDGLCGNDDCGQMSAWYIFSAMGFYPVCPGSGEYVLGAPHLPYMRLKFENGRTLEIKAPRVSDRNRYVRSVKLNGRSYDKMYITHEDIMGGGVLEFTMSPSPDKRRGIAAEDKPYSMTRN